MTVQERLDQIGPGAYQLMLIVCIGGAHLIENLEPQASANTALSRAYQLSDVKRSLLPIATASGSAIGLLASGPLSDWKGRKTVLLLGVSLMSAIAMTTAVLPSGSISANALLSLRFVWGFGKDTMKPAGIVLAVESCPVSVRPHIVFGIQMLMSIGFFMEALMCLTIMPHFGESPDDNYRLYYAIIAFLALAMLPGTMLLRESPSFLAVKGDAEACVEVLDDLARMNGQPPLRENVVRISSGPDQNSPRHLSEVAGAFTKLLLSHMGLIFMLGLIDSSRAFFTQGTSYLWKDLFQLLQGKHISASMLNFLASVAPFVGVFVSERMLWVGVRQITVICAALASIVLACLTEAGVRGNAWSLLNCILLVKLTYGPLTTCISLIKAEVFPTEIRVCAFSFISIFAEVTGMFGPMMVEVLKENELATSWKPRQLNYFIIILMTSVMLCGLLTFIIPGRSGDGKQLRDFFEHRNYAKRIRSDGSLRDLLELQSSDSEGEQPPPIPRPKTAPNMQRGIGSPQRTQRA